MRIYTASKTKYADRWLRLRARGWPITCSWLTRFDPYDYAHLPDVAEQCVREASEADAVILYAAPGDELRGAFMEVGAALASGVLVWFVNTGRWNDTDLPDLLRHPLVRTVCCVEHALKYAVETFEREQKRHCPSGYMAPNHVDHNSYEQQSKHTNNSNGRNATANAYGY